jgi:hypothetical protein
VRAKTFIFLSVLLLAQVALAKRQFLSPYSDGQVEFYFETSSGVFAVGNGKSALQALAPTLLKNDGCAKTYAAIIDAALPKLRASLTPKLAQFRVSKKDDRVSVTFALSTHYDFPKNNPNYDRCSLNVTLARKSNDNWAEFTPLTYSNRKGTLTVDRGFYHGDAPQTPDFLAAATMNYLGSDVLKIYKSGARTANTVTPLESTR